jgi:hypothetical protein
MGISAFSRQRCRTDPWIAKSVAAAQEDRFSGRQKKHDPGFPDSPSLIGLKVAGFGH